MNTLEELRNFNTMNLSNFYQATAKAIRILARSSVVLSENVSRLETLIGKNMLSGIVPRSEVADLKAQVEELTTRLDNLE